MKYIFQSFNRIYTYNYISSQKEVNGQRCRNFCSVKKKNIKYLNQENCVNNSKTNFANNDGVYN